MAWIGYRTPQTLRTITGRAAAIDGGPRARRRARRDRGRPRVGGSPPARTTVLAHSYGTVVVDEAADLPGRLAADAVVLLGSPGMTGDAAALEAPEVYDAGSRTTRSPGRGGSASPPLRPPSGRPGCPTDLWAGHSDYYDVDGPTLPAMGEVVAGVREPG